MNKPEKLRVVIVEPGQYAREAEIDNTLQAEQAVVAARLKSSTPGQTKLFALCSTMKEKSFRWNQTVVYSNTGILCSVPFSSAETTARIFAA